MKIKSTIKYPAIKPATMELREAISLPGVGLSIPVRAAKAKLSALLELVAGGQEVTITSDGVPKAVLSPVGKREARKVFTGMGDYLMKQPVHGGPSADEIIRAERDSRP
ncbi:MAG: type II toxin-antitoxin system prevent-host-death family antitoxin [Limisphaerales bacterium]